MIKFKESKKNRIQKLNYDIIYLRDSMSIINQQIKDLEQHQKDMVNTFNAHQHSKGSQYTHKTYTPTIYMSYCND